MRLQCQEVSPRIPKMSTAQCTMDILRHEGFRGFYRGLATPMVGSVLENIVLFVAYSKIQRLIQGPDATSQPTIPQLAVSGAAAGAMVSAVLTPVELIKCKIQMHASLYRGTADCILKTIRSTGLLGLYRGHAATFARESCGGAAWFGTYEATCRFLSKDGTKDSLGAGSLMFAGALSGIAYNTVVFPADVVKSQIQAEPSTGSGSAGKGGYLRRLRALYHSEGIRGLYRGYGITLVRAVPANAIILASFELANRTLKF